MYSIKFFAITFLIMFCSFNLEARTITFDDTDDPSSILHQDDDITFPGDWHLSGPYLADPSNNIWSTDAIPSFVLNAQVLTSLSVYVSQPCSLTISDNVNSDFSQTLSPGLLYDIFPEWVKASGVIQLHGCGSKLGISTIEFNEYINSDTQPPIVNITFPTPSALSDAETIVVRGTASDDSAIASIVVNDVSAATTDGFANWVATVPLVEGLNTLIVEASDTVGNTNSEAATARVNKDITMPQWVKGIAIDPSNDLAYLTDWLTGDLIAVDLNTGIRNNITHNKNGDQGPVILNAESVTLDLPNDQAFVLSTRIGSESLFSVDLDSGQRRIVSDNTTSANVSISGAVSHVQDLPNNRVLLTTRFNTELIAIDLSTGLRTVISSSGANGGPVGSGPVITFPSAIIMDAVNNRVLVSDLLQTTVYAIDLSSGNRSILTDNSTGTGPTLYSISTMSFDASNDRVIVFDRTVQSMVAIDLNSGNRTVISNWEQGSGRLFEFAESMLLQEITGRILLNDAMLNSIFLVDTANGNRSTLSLGGHGTGTTSVGLASSVVWDANSNSALLLSGNDILEVDINNSNQSLLLEGFLAQPNGLNGMRKMISTTNGRQLLTTSDQALATVNLVSGVTNNVSIGSPYSPDVSIGNGPDMVNPRAISQGFGNNQAYVAGNSTSGGYGQSDTIFSVDLNSGDRSIISSTTIGNGPVFNFASALMADSDRNQILVTDFYQNTLVRVDPVTGNRSILSGNGVGSGPVLSLPNSIQLDNDNGRALITNNLSHALTSIDLNSGDRSFISSQTTGNGPGLYWPESSALDSANNRVWIYGGGAVDTLYLVDIESGDRVIVSK